MKAKEPVSQRDTPEGYIAVARESWGDCSHCDAHKLGNCDNFKCMAFYRDDKQSVLFKEIE